MEPKTKRKQEKRPGIKNAPVSKVSDETVKNLAKALDAKEPLIYAAGAVLFAGLTTEQQFKALHEIRVAHAELVKAEQAENKPTAETASAA